MTRRTDTNEPDDAQRQTPTRAPSLRQRAVLDVYVGVPNAMAVARITGSNERHVRRLVDQYPAYVEEQRRVRDAERLERESARGTRIQDWLDETLEVGLRRLDQLTESANEAVALRALKLKLELAMGVGRLAHPANTADGLLAELERALADQAAEAHRRTGS